jgi:hypothetical protein
MWRAPEARKLEFYDVSLFVEKLIFLFHSDSGIGALLLDTKFSYSIQCSRHYESGYGNVSVMSGALLISQ